MSCTYYGSGTYELGEMAGDGWGFIGWFGDCPDPGTGTTTTVTVTPDSSATCTATFRNRSDGGACVTFGQMCSDTSGPCCPTAAGMAIPCDGLVPPDDPTGTCCSSLTCDPQGNGCCAGFQCDLASGKCFVPDGGTESGTDAGGDAAEAGPTCTEPLAACTSTGQCCQYTLANGEPVQPACNGNECCVNWNGGDCRTSLDCCGTYPCTPIGTAGDTQCCEPAQGPCMVATDCCIAGAANNQCNGNKCCISTGYTCGNGGTLHNEACCSNVCLSNGQCQ
jgi:hypothetical protein